MRDVSKKVEDQGISYMSARLLALETEQEQFSFILKNLTFLKGINVGSGAKFVHNNYITCMSKVYKNIEDPKS